MALVTENTQNILTAERYEAFKREAASHPYPEGRLVYLLNRFFGATPRQPGEQHD